MSKVACERALERMGYKLDYTIRRSVSLAQESDLAIAALEGKPKYEAWILDSLLTGFRAVEWGELKLAFRCLLQAKEYAGRLGSVGVTESDSMAALQNMIEASRFSEDS